MFLLLKTFRNIFKRINIFNIKFKIKFKTLFIFRNKVNKIIIRFVILISKINNIFKKLITFK